MLQLNGKTLRHGKAFVTEDGRQFPANWLRLRLWKKSNLLESLKSRTPLWRLGTQRFYWGVDNPKDLDQLKETWTAKVKANCRLFAQLH